MRTLETFLLWIQKQHFNLYKALLVVGAAVLTAWLMPAGQSHGLNYTIGEPWALEDLVAKEAFPVLKSPQQRAADRKRIQAGIPRFYDLDTAGLTDYLDGAGFSGSFRAAVATYLASGILAHDEIQADRQGESVMIKRSSGYESKVLGALPDQTKAVAYLEREWKKMYRDSVAPAFALPPNTLVRNVTVEEALANERLARLSVVSGMVMAGERVVRRGEPVTAELALTIDSYLLHEGQSSSPRSLWQRRTGHFILAGLLLGVLFLFLWRFRPVVLETSGTFTFIFVVWMLDVAMARAMVWWSPTLIYLAPFALVPVLVRSFLDTRIALFVHFTAILMCAFMAPQSLQFVYLQFIAGFTALVASQRWYKRSQLILSALQITAVYAIGYLGWMLLSGDFSYRGSLQYLWLFAGSGLLTLLAFPLIYFSEKIFGLLSDVTLLELSDTNHPLLRELSERAPGTFQHSLQVANLAESAAAETGGNTLLVRVGAMFHDVGKLKKPLYFVENQSQGHNPHHDLSFGESARIIIDHVKEGIVLARQYNLPDRVVDFIRTHHGTTAVQYFYRKYLQSFPEDQKALEKFTYPGPQPFSLETALVMMADSIEAAARSLEQPSPEQLDALVEAIVNRQLQEGQFQNAPVTLKDIQRAKKVFKKKLAGMYHHRVAYPEASEKLD
jgi:putative nucleotidyltransferase with HDIG domain